MVVTYDHVCSLPVVILLASTSGNPSRLWLKAGSGPDSAEATENTEWVRTEFTENYDFPIPGFSSVTG